MTIKLHRSGVIPAGLALFAMFFGAGDLIWPLILGGQAGDHNLFSMLGLLITGVSLPLLGLVAMMLFQGNYKEFFAQTGRLPGWILLFVIQAILGPLGSLPRLITLSHATIFPYLHVNLITFSLISCGIVLLFTLKKQRIVDIMGVFLTPILLLALGAILVIGFLHHPSAPAVVVSNGKAFMSGLHGGYNTLDLIASFIFAPVVFRYFQQDESTKNPLEARRHVFKKMLKSCFIAGALLSIMYFGLSYLGSYFTHLMPPHDEAEKLGLIAQILLGPTGAFFASIAVTLSCLTTAIPICMMSAEYINKEFMKGKGNIVIATCIPLLISTALANLGFMGIAQMLAPVLQILCPGLIILCVLNILNKLFEIRTPRAPVFIAFGASTTAYFTLPLLIQ